MEASTSIPTGIALGSRQMDGGRSEARHPKHVAHGWRDERGFNVHDRAGPSHRELGPDSTSIGHSAHRRRRAVAIFHLEVRQSLHETFRLSAGEQRLKDGGVVEGASTEDTAAKILDEAASFVEQRPGDRSRTIVTIQEKLETAASATRDVVGASDDLKEIDDVVALVNQGLAGLAGGEPVSRESSLALNAVSRQRSVLYIRTQEGDRVKLDLRQTDSIAVRDTTGESGGAVAGYTEISLSSSSRLKVGVHGDLNESELAAIREVLLQAESIANEFFSGDLLAAFDEANGIQIDSDQLARVKLRLSSNIRVTGTYSAIQALAPRSTGDSSEAVAVAGATAVPKPSAPIAEDVSQAAAPATVEDAADPLAQGEVGASDQSGTLPESSEPVPSAESPPAGNPFSGFFASVATFLSAYFEGFDSMAQADSHSLQLSLRASTILKVEVLKAVLASSAPEGAEAAADAVSEVLDQLGSAPAEQLPNDVVA